MKRNFLWVVVEMSGSLLREKAFGPRVFGCLGNSKGSGVFGFSPGRKSLNCLRFTVYRFRVTVLSFFTRGVASITQYF